MRLKNGVLKKSYVKEIKDMDVDFCTENFCTENNVQDFLNKTEKYLVLFHHYRWDNSSGAGFYSFEQLPNRCVPDYASCCKLVKTDGKRMLLRVYHHDKPLGFNEYIYSLNKKEYEALRQAQRYEELEKFVMEKFSAYNTQN